MDEAWDEATERKAIKLQWGLRSTHVLDSSLVWELCTLSFCLTSVQSHLGFNYSYILYTVPAAPQYSAHCPHLRYP